MFFFFFFSCFFNDTATTEIYTLSLHDALPIYVEKIPFLLDVNNYQAKKIEELRNLARMSAQRVRYFKKEVEMRPMTSYERRIIHSTLAEYLDIETKSSGEDPNRKVIIKLYSTEKNNSEF